MMSLWANRCPSRATMAKYTPLSEGKCEKGSEKRREEVIKKKIYIYTWGFVMSVLPLLNARRNDVFGSSLFIPVCVKCIIYTLKNS